jgi:glycosyltransferase domain-containing protein
MARKNITILIPTHNRPAYLKRSLDWFLSGGFRVIVADSTRTLNDEVSQLQNSKLTYLHRPGGYEVYTAKIYEALRLVDTPYVALCADDDFILYEGLEQGERFLDSNADYAFYQGMAYFFQIIGKRLALWPFLYSADLASDFWVARVVEPKNTVFYGVNRSVVALKAFKVLQNQALVQNESAAGLVDATFTAIVARTGKLMFEQTPFALREYSPTVMSVGSRYQLLFNHNLPTFLSALFSSLVADDKLDEASSVLLKKWLAQDIAGQIVYDGQASRGVRSLANKFSPRVRETIEFTYRTWQLLKLTSSVKGLKATRVFFNTEYHSIKKKVLHKSAM